MDTNKIDEQLSAFADGELPAAEAQLLLARLARDPTLRGRWERYHAIGESLRGGLPARYPRGLAAAVEGALTEDQAHAGRRSLGRFAMPLVGAAVAASVALVGVIMVRDQGQVPGAPVAPLTASAERPMPQGAMVVEYTPAMQAKLGAYVVRHGESAGRALPTVAQHVRVAAKEPEELPAATPASAADPAAPATGSPP